MQDHQAFFQNIASEIFCQLAEKGIYGIKIAGICTCIF
jgi:hypothetical protein